MTRNIAGFVIALGLGLSAPSSSQAQSANAAKQEAQKLYQDAAKDMDAREYARACPKLEAARKILPDHVRTAISLAECYDKLDEPATALEAFEVAQALAKAQNSTDKLAEIDAKLAALRPRVPHLTISVPKEFSSLPGLSITRNAVPVPVTQWGNAVAVNPGTYQIEVTAVDKEPWTTSTEVEIGKDFTIEITPPWKAAPSPEPTVRIEERPQSMPETPSSPLRTVGIVGISLGVVGIGAGAILGGLAVSKNNASDDGHCKANNVCSQIGFDLRTEARSLGHGSTAAFIVGGALLAGGVALVVVGGKNKESSDKAQTSVWVGPTSVGVRGRW